MQERAAAFGGHVIVTGGPGEGHDGTRAGFLFRSGGRSQKLMIDVIVCDDHPVLRQGLARIIQNSLKSVRFSEADGGQTLLDLLREQPADVVLLDVGLARHAAVSKCFGRSRSERPRQPVLMLSVHPADQYAVRALRAGASGYLTKDLPVDELIKAVRIVCRRPSLCHAGGRRPSGRRSRRPADQ